MKLLDRFEKRFFRFAIPNLTIILIIGQIVVFTMNYMKIIPLDAFILIGSKVLEGQYWRVLTFLFIPIPTDLFFAAFTWYIYYLYGSALESEWGTFNYNFYILISYLLSLVIAFVFPNSYITNAYLFTTVFLAFAYLFPDFVLYIFFILPLKIKWLALFVWLGYGYVLITAPFVNKILLLVSIANFLLFFGSDIILKIKYGQKNMHRDIDRIKKKKEYFHKCIVCGITDIDNPNMEFRYCSKCEELACYCKDHINSHECIVKKK